MEAGFSQVEFRPLTSLPFLYRFSRFFSLHFPIYMPGLWLVSTTLIIAKK